MTKQPPPTNIKKQLDKDVADFVANGGEIKQLGKAKNITEVIENMNKNARQDGVSPESDEEVDRKEAYNKRARKWNKNELRDK